MGEPISMVNLRNWICSFTVTVFNKDRYLCVSPPTQPSAKLSRRISPIVFPPAPASVASVLKDARLAGGQPHCLLPLIIRYANSGHSKDNRLQAVLEPAFLANVLADARLAALLAQASLAVVLADAHPAPLLALFSFAVVLADARPPCSLHCLLVRLCSQMLGPPRCLH